MVQHYLDQYGKGKTLTSLTNDVLEDYDITVEQRIATARALNALAWGRAA